MNPFCFYCAEEIRSGESRTPHLEPFLETFVVDGEPREMWLQNWGHADCAARYAATGVWPE